MYLARTPEEIRVLRKVSADLLEFESAAALDDAVDVTVADKRRASGTTVVVPMPVTFTKRTEVEGFWWIAIARTEKVRIAKKMPRNIFMVNRPTHS